MYRLIRFYNQNRRRILIIILIIVFILGIIQLLNYFSRMKIAKEDKQNALIENTEINKDVVSEKSLISGQNVSGTQLNSETELIDEFIKYCNNKDLNSAYEMLSEECKEEMFPTIDDFYNNYYKNLFNEYKTYTVENWIGSTYQVRFTGDILSTGNLNTNETKQDYITIVQNNNENKLNINSYIERKMPKEVTEENNVKVTIKSIDTYMDYEIYNLSIQNNSDNSILLDTNNDTKSVYLLDSRDMKYYFYSNEIIANRLMVKSKFTNDLKIKFTNSYSSSRKISSLVFSKMVLNYDEYKNLENKEEYQFNEFRINI